MIEVKNVRFTIHIECDEGSKIKVEGTVKFNDKTIILFADASFIDFGTSQIERIWNEIAIHNSLKLNNDQNTKKVSIICVSNFD